MKGRKWVDMVSYITAVIQHFTCRYKAEGPAKELVVLIFGYLATDQGATSHAHTAKTYTALRVCRRRRGSLATVL